MAKVDLVARCRDAGDAISAELKNQIAAIERLGPLVIAVQIPVRAGRTDKGQDRWHVEVKMNIRDRDGVLRHGGAQRVRQAMDDLCAFVTAQLDTLPDTVAEARVDVDLFAENLAWVTVTRTNDEIPELLRYSF